MPQRDIFISQNSNLRITSDDASGVLTFRVSDPAHRSGGAGIVARDEYALLALLTRRAAEREEFSEDD